MTHHNQTVREDENMSTFTAEDRTFRRHVRKWLDGGLEGMWAMIGGEHIIAILPNDGNHLASFIWGAATYGYGHVAAVEKGQQPMLRQITAQEDVSPVHGAMMFRDWEDADA